MPDVVAGGLDSGEGNPQVPILRGSELQVSCSHCDERVLYVYGMVKELLKKVPFGEDSICLCLLRIYLEES